LNSAISLASGFDFRFSGANLASSASALRTCSMSRDDRVSAFQS